MTELILPAGIDIHVHFREPGFEHKETMETGMNTARAGGIHTVIDMPNTIPVTDTVQAFVDKQTLAEKVPGVNIIAAITSSNVNNGQLKELQKHSRVFKVFMANSTGNLGIDTPELLKGMELLDERKNNIMMIHAEKPQYIRDRGEKTVENSIRPEIAEIEAIQFMIDQSMEFRNLKFHITHVSTLAGAELLMAQDRVSWDVVHKYLDFHSDLVKTKGNYAKMNPPLRSQKNMMGLNHLLEEGKIPIVSSDHAPHTRQEKKGLVAGAPGVQELYHTMIDRYLKDKISLKYLRQIMVDNPTKFMKKAGFTPITGEIIIETEENTIVNPEFAKSKCGWSLWQGREFRGRIISS